MPALDFTAALDVLVDASPAELGELLTSVAAPLGGRELTVSLVDFQGLVLEPVDFGRSRSGPDATGAAEPVTGSMAGRALRTGEPVVAERDGGVRVWVPLVERGERTGVVALTLEGLDDAVVAECVRLGAFAGLLVRSFARTTDLMHLRRRQRTMTLAAGMQWDLLPPLTVRCARGLACGRLEPAYSIAGDAFDYSLNDPVLDAAVFDGMGHGVHSTLMTALAVGAYRHARRSGASLAEMYLAMDQAMAAQYAGDAFVTAVVARLDLDRGNLEWASAGHPAPLLVRDQRVVRQLACTPSLPLGLGGTLVEQSTEGLEPGDCVLFFTDGVVEGRDGAGEEFGVERLAERWEHHAASLHEADEVLRRLVDDVSAFSNGDLRDDASLMLLRWSASRVSD